MKARKRLLTAKEWAEANYETPPNIQTVWRWIREGKIHPAPQKHGRAYMFKANAEYFDAMSLQ